MKLGSWMSIVGFLAGIWIIVSPYLMGFARVSGSPWHGVLGTDILGVVLALASIVGLVGFWGHRLRELEKLGTTTQES